MGCKQPFGYIYSIILTANPSGGNYGSSFVVEATEGQVLNPGHTTERAVGSVSKKSAGCSYSAPPPGGTPGSQRCPALANSCCQLALGKGLSKPLSFILNKAHHIIRLLQIYFLSGSEATGLSRFTSSLYGINSRSRESRATSAPAGPRLTQLRSAQLLGLSK